MDDPSRPVADYHGNNPDQPALDAAFWDRPDADVEKDGPGLVEIWAVKNAMLRDGYALKYPAPPESRDHWKVVYPGSG